MIKTYGGARRRLSQQHKQQQQCHRRSSNTAASSIVAQYVIIRNNTSSWRPSDLAKGVLVLIRSWVENAACQKSLNLRENKHQQQKHVRAKRQQRCDHKYIQQSRNLRDNNRMQTTLARVKNKKNKRESFTPASKLCGSVLQFNSRPYTRRHLA